MMIITVRLSSGHTITVSASHENIAMGATYYAIATRKTYSILAEGKILIIR